MHGVQLSAFVFSGLLKRGNYICLFFFLFLFLFYLLVLLAFAPVGLLGIYLVIIFVYLSWYLFQILTKIQIYSFAWYPVVETCVHGIDDSIFGFLLFFGYLVWNKCDSIIIDFLVHSYLSPLIDE